MLRVSFPRRFAGAALLALAACSSQTPSEDGDSSDETALTEADGPAAESTPSSTPSAAPVEPGGALPPADAERRYIGRWAARADLCREGGWVFTRDHLATAGEVSCDFTEVTGAAGGYDIAARCTAEGPPQDDSFTLRFAESAKAMLVEGSSVVSDVGLIYCGPA